MVGSQTRHEGDNRYRVGTSIMTLKCCIIGCGMFGGYYEDFNSSEIYSHAKGYYKNSNFSSISVIDLNKSKAEFLAKKVGGESFADIPTMLKNFQPDVVSIVTPDDTHFSIAKQILELSSKTKIIFVEKPICDNIFELSSLKKIEEKSKTKIIVNHSRRFDPQHQNIKRIINKNTFGLLKRIHVNYYGGWQHLGVHIVDYLHFVFNTNIKFHNTSFAHSTKYSNDSTLHVSGEILGAPINFVGFDENNYQILEINIFFELGQIKFTDFGKKIDIFTLEINDEKEKILVLDENLSMKAMENPMESSIKLIADYIKNPDPKIIRPYNLEEAEKTMSTIWKGKNFNAS